MGVAGPRPGARTVRVPRADPVRPGPAPWGRHRRTRRHARGCGVSGPSPVRGAGRHGGSDGLDGVRRARRLLPAPRPDRHPPRGAPERGRSTRHRGHDGPPARAPAAPVLRCAASERSLGLRRPTAPPRARSNAPARPGTGPRAKDDATAWPRAGERAAPRRAVGRAAPRGARAPARHARSGACIARTGPAARLAVAPGRSRPRARRSRRTARRGAARTPPPRPPHRHSTSVARRPHCQLVTT